MDLSYSAWQNCQNAEFEETFEVSDSVQPSALDLYNLRPSNEPRNTQLWIHANIIETKTGSEGLYLIKCKTSLYNQRSRVTWSWNWAEIEVREHLTLLLMNFNDGYQSSQSNLSLYLLAIKTRGQFLIRRRSNRVGSVDSFILQNLEGLKVFLSKSFSDYLLT